MRKKKKKKEESELDLNAWIVLRLPRKLWTKGQMLLEKLKENFCWNVSSGEMKFINKKKKNKWLKGSNVVQVVHHALDDSTPQPDGYEVVFPYLLHGSTPPKTKAKQKAKQKAVKKKLQKKLLPKEVNEAKMLRTKPFVKDKFLWQVL